MKAVKTIYLEDKAIHFSDRIPVCSGAVYEVAPREELTPAKMVEIIENNKHLTIISEDSIDTYNRFINHLIVVEAAGGVVEDDSGRVLMIYRHSRWDLPKGHVESGERYEQTAVREVMEETGLRHITSGDFLCITEHFHCAYGRWELKRTWWYAMSASSCQPLSPQMEEDIVEAEWYDREQCIKVLEGTYGTIKEVMTKFYDVKRRYNVSQ